MATKKVWAGPTGPWSYDDTQKYSGETVDLEGIRTDGQINVGEAPTIDNHVVRKGDVATLLGIPKVLSVANIDDPSAELNAISGTEVGQPMFVYETESTSNQYTVYHWDSADSVSEDVPYRVDSSGSGMWIAQAGKYRDNEWGQYQNHSATAQTNAVPLRKVNFSPNSHMSEYAASKDGLVSDASFQTVLQFAPDRLGSGIGHCLITGTEIGGTNDYGSYVLSFAWHCNAGTHVITLETEDFTKEATGATDWDVQAAVSGSNILINVKGENTQNINWAAFLTVVETVDS